MDEHTEGILINIIEEASEVSQIAAKCLRFGLESFDPNDPDKTTNAVLLSREIGNLRYMADQGMASDFIDDKEIGKGYLHKAERLKKYPLIIKGKSNE